MRTQHDPPSPRPAEAGASELGPATSSERIRLAVAYNDALDRCIRTGGETIDELMDLLADDAQWIWVGGPSFVGTPAIRASFAQRAARYQQVVELRGIELWGDFIICRTERRDTTFVEPDWERGIRILLVKDGKIQQTIVISDPEVHARMRGGTPFAFAEER